MAEIVLTPPLGVQETSVQKSRISRWVIALRRRWRQRKLPPVPNGNPHLYRDIGLSPTDQARLNHQWPSQTQHHPRG